MKVNYALRPAKNIERKICVRFMARLDAFGQVDQYRYVGFGAETFADFRLVQRSLHIQNMVSIEANTASILRFKHNAPFDYIEVQPGWSWDVLREMSWDQRSIVWLDYECWLNTNVISDLKYLIDSMALGSMLILTVNAQPLTFQPEPIEQLRKNVEDRRVRIDVSFNDLKNWGTAAEYYAILKKEIERTLRAKNKRKAPGSELRLSQVMHFLYEDGAKMMTLGFVLHDEGQRQVMTNCGFHLLREYRPSDAAFEISVPDLTYTEMRYLAKQLRRRDNRALANVGLSIADLEAYEKVHGYFPAFTESEL